MAWLSRYKKSIVPALNLILIKTVADTVRHIFDAVIDADHRIFHIFSAVITTIWFLVFNYLIPRIKQYDEKKRQQASDTGRV